ncbi:HAD-IC family P-type ATPase [Nonomuraea turcica]|uniref:HAD-IC family P-type ATPase n=1 Tax=Nonomuraea sp. G32 TaxID=3067274 RepID=UPI00273C1C7C|nr:HAD-IC family P-type ATPase [Nonomuraea sp. G32]MDP4503308.1 HAD-IC family P-type ATPase [Nonomuraea sp. G32]
MGDDMRLSGVLPTAGTLLKMLPRPVRGMLRCPRLVRTCPGGVRIEVWNVGGPRTEDAARDLEERLLSAGVHRAEVNGALGCVFVGCDVDTVDLDKLVAIVENVDEVPEASDGGSQAFDGMEQQARAAVGLGLHLAGTAVALAGQVARIRKLPPAVPAVLSLAEHNPWLRRELAERVGPPAADVVATSTRIISHALALRPVALMIDTVAAAGRYLDSCAGRRAWELREEEFAVEEGAYRHIRTSAAPRPERLPGGPVERYAAATTPGALAAYGVTAAITRDHQRGLSVLTTATPKAARLGRDVFASAVLRALAERDTLVLDGHALQRMDRIDTVLLDAHVLTTGAWTVDSIVRLDPGADADEVHTRLYSLLDLTDPWARRERDGWAVEPFTARHEPAQVSQWREHGVHPVALSREGSVVALAGMAPELHPLAEAVVAAPKGTCAVVLAGGDGALARRLGIDRVVGGGTRLAASVRALQAEGHGVAVVSQRSRRGLSQADLGIGVLDDPRRRVPWDADVIGGLDGVHLLLRCLPHARKASERSVRVAAAGAIAGAGLAAIGPRRSALGPAYLVANCTAVAALVAGEWMGRRAGREAPPIPADPTPWHAMSAGDVLARLRTSPQGLTEAQARDRRTATAASPARHHQTFVRACVSELANPLTPVLAAGAGVSAAVGSVLDAGLISGVIGVGGLLGGAQRWGVERTLHRLTHLTVVQARVRRPDGLAIGVAGDLVCGDVVELRAGDTVPADGRLIKAVGLEVDESTLTGESQLVSKAAVPTASAAIADRTSMVYQGTSIAAGRGLAVVVATGDATEAGRTAALTAAGPPASGVELRLHALSRRILPLAIGSGLILMVTELLRGSRLAAAVGPAISLAVAAVPEGLPFIATVAELASAKRLSTRNALVRNPSTIEALGRVDVLCFDKTGTLTEGRISLGKVSDGRTEQSAEALTPELKAIVGAAVRACPPYGGGRGLAHPTDRAVVEGATKLGIAPGTGLKEWQRVDELPFEPGRGYHAVLGLTESGHVLSVKGAPEVVLTRCGSLAGGPLDDQARRELEEEVDRLALQGYRVLAVAERDASSRADLDESRIGRLRFLGFLGLADPVRPTAKRSVEGLMRAGVRVIMITGDHPSTAEAIAAEINALNGLKVMTGPEIDGLDDDALAEELPKAAVFARMTPKHKARIVAGLRRAGKIVAVTGDGANDVPAIRLADVGVALGPQATPAARAAADIVVIDDRIETLIDAVVEGRAMWGSVRDSLSMLLGGNVGEIAFTLGSTLLTGRRALNTRQLLLVNLLTDMLPAMAVAVRPPRAAGPDRLLAEGPEASLGAALTRDIYLRAATTAAAASLAWILARMSGTRGRADTVGLIGLVGAQLVQTLMMGRRNRLVLLASLSSLAALGAIVSVPGLSTFFGCRPIGPFGWCIGLGCAAAAVLAGDLIERAVARQS